MGLAAVVEWLADKGISGIPFVGFASAEDLAKHYLANPTFATNGQRIDAVIRWETARNFTTGFILGVPSVLLLPLTLPCALVASWLIQARLAASIAVILGHDVRSPEVRILVLCCLLGEAVESVLKVAGISAGQKLAVGVLHQIPRQILTMINQQAGRRLVTKFGQTATINLVKWVPIVGGVIGGIIDGFMCWSVGKIARKAFDAPSLPLPVATAPPVPIAVPLALPVAVPEPVQSPEESERRTLLVMLGCSSLLFVSCLGAGAGFSLLHHLLKSPEVEHGKERPSEDRGRRPPPRPR